MSFTADAKPGVVYKVLSERGIVLVDVDWDEQNGVSIVRPYGRDSDVPAMLDLQRAGVKCWTGYPRQLHSDPTYAQAAQNITLREHGVRRGRS